MQMRINIGVIVIIVKMNLLTLWPWSLKYEPQNHVTFRLFPIPSLNTLGSFVFKLWSGQTNRQTNRQANKQTEAYALPMTTESAWISTKTCLSTPTLWSWVWRLAPFVCLAVYVFVCLLVLSCLSGT